jgi:hypothetical protein
MNTHTITRGLALVASRLVALIAGCIFVAGAAALLFADVALNGAAIKLPHVLTVVTLSGTLLVGHLMGEAWGTKHWLRSIGFGVLFVVGTLLVVYQSSGKQAETTFASQAEADFNESERQRIKPLLAKDQKRLSDTKDAVQRDCVDGKKGKTHCDALRETLGVYQAAVKGHNSDLARIGPAKPLEPEAENIANVAAVFGVDKAKVKAGAVLVVPFIRTILFELGGLWCLGFAFRPLPKSATQETKAEQPRKPLSPAEQSDFYADDIEETRKLGIGGNPGAGNWGNSGNGGGTDRNGGKPKPVNGGTGAKRRVLSRSEALLDLTRRLASRETVAAQDELAEAWGVD